MFKQKLKFSTQFFVILLDEYTHGSKACPSHAAALGLEHAVRAPSQSQPVPQFDCVSSGADDAHGYNTAMQTIPFSGLAACGSICLHTFSSEHKSVILQSAD